MSLPNEAEPEIAGRDRGPDRFARQREELGSLDSVPLDRHAEIFARVHDELRSALAEIDDL